MSPRRLALLALLGALTLPSAAGAADARWLLAQPAPPSPPEGAQPAPYPIPYGAIGDIAFWAPNRGLMMVDGDGTLIKDGIYRYDGARWSLYATVCGGAAQSARIVWAGPTEFWTISDKREGSGNTDVVIPNGSTLCHFKDGAVVGSYAVPRSSPGGYLPMYAGACNAPDDCWFGGDALAAPGAGAFHLHWDGATVSRVIAPQGRPVASMTTYRGSIFEAVKISGDGANPRLSPLLPEYPFGGSTEIGRVNRFVAGGRDATAIVPQPFAPQFRVTTATGAAVPNYPIDGHELTALDADGDRLWAAGGKATSGPSTAAERIPLVALKDGDGPLTEWQLPRSRFTSSGALRTNPITDLAAVPGTDDAWVLFRGVNRIARITADPAVAVSARVPTIVNLPDSANDPSPAAQTTTLGNPLTIDCPAKDDCWLGTDQGWVFHYTDGTSTLPVDTDPAFARVITERPDDGLTPTTFSDAPPVDDSLTDLQFFDATLPPPADEPAPAADPAPAPRARNVKVAAVGRTGFRISFTLTARARVKVTASRGGRVVAQSKRAVLRRGPHRLTFRVSPKRWPTKINLDVREP